MSAKSSGLPKNSPATTPEPANPSGNSSKFAMVSVSALHVDPSAQRALSKAWVKARIPHFDVDQLGYIVVNVREHMFVVDGQHRVELMRAVGWGDQRIHAEVFYGLTQAQEAALFNARNDRKAVRRYDKFRIAVTAGMPSACDIDRIVRKYGLVVSDRSKEGHIAAVDALEQIYAGAGVASQAEGAHALGAALECLIRAWGKQASSVNGRILMGIAMVLMRYRGKIDAAGLAEKLAPFPGGAPGVLGRARGMQELRGRAIQHCAASIIVDVYNKGRRSNLIDRWES